jgi:hypothetical protein
MSQHPQMIRLAGRELERPCHACAFFQSREEEERVLLPFAQEGLEQGERGFHIVDAQKREERRRALAHLGIDVDAAERRGQLEIQTWENAYVRDRRFDQDAMLALVHDILSQGQAGGFGLTRLWANMEWAVEELPGVYDLVEYEIRLNQLLPQFEDVVVCTYDLTRFRATVVIQILRTHPLAIIGGTMQVNPFYVPPEELLRELHAQAVPPPTPAPDASCASLTPVE